MVVQKYWPVFHVIDVGTYLVHAVGGFDGHHIVNLRTGETAIDQVDGLVAAIAKENLLWLYPLVLGYQFFHIPLQGVGVAVVGLVVWILIGIQEL